MRPFSAEDALLITQPLPGPCLDKAAWGWYESRTMGNNPRWAGAADPAKYSSVHQTFGVGGVVQLF